MVSARLWTSWRSCGADTSGCASRAARTERGDNGVTSGMEAPAGEDGSEVEGVDWGVQFASVLALTFFRPLCLRGCLRWYALIKASACICSTGSHVLSLCGYPFHLIRYWSRRRCPKRR